MNFMIGDGVDVMITGGLKQYKDNFIVGTFVERPTAKAALTYMDYVIHYLPKGIEISDIIPSKIDEDTLNEFFDNLDPTVRDTFVKVSNMKKGYKTFAAKTAYRKIFSSHGNITYFTETYCNPEQKVLSKSESDVIERIYRQLRESASTYKYLFEEQEGVLRFFQFPILFNYQGVRCKALLDLMIVDTVNKVIKPCDLKTSKDKSDKFKRPFMFWKYYVQAALYKKAVIELRNNSKDLYEKGLFPVDLSDYRIENFRFIVASKDPFTQLPLVYKLDDEFEAFIGADERQVKMVDSVPYANLYSIIEDYKWACSNKFFDKHPRYIDPNYEVVIGL